MNKFVTMLFAAGLLTACGGIEVSQIPISSISSTGEIQRGIISARADFTSEFSLTADGTGVVCSGQTNARGVGSMTCTDGRIYEIAIPNYPGYHGSFLEYYEDETVATGYGNGADLALLQELLLSE